MLMLTASLVSVFGVIITLVGINSSPSSPLVPLLVVCTLAVPLSCQETMSKNVMKALESRVAKLEVQVQTSVSKSLNKHVDQVNAQMCTDCTYHYGRECKNRSGIHIRTK